MKDAIDWARTRFRRGARSGWLLGLRLLRRAPFDSERFGPPRRFSPTARGWCEGVGRTRLAAGGGGCEQVHDSLSHSRTPPRTLDGRTPWPFHVFYGGLHAEDSPGYVFTIANARVCGEGAVIAPGDHLLGDVSREFIQGGDQRRHSLFSKWRLPPVEYMDGSVAVVAVQAANVYWHWMFDCLPRLGLLMARKDGLHGIDYFVTNAITSPYQRETLELLGIEPGKRLEAGKSNFHIRARAVIVPSMTQDAPSVWACRFLRSELLARMSPPARETPKRIYVSRVDASTRRVVNEEELVAELERHGFVRIIMTALSVTEQAALFAGAEVIVAPHGSGLTNMVFSAAGTRLIEIFPPHYVNPCFWAIADAMGVDYYCMFGEGLLPPEPPVGRDPEDWFYSHKRRGSPYGEDIMVDVGQLRALMRLAKIV